MTGDFDKFMRAAALGFLASRDGYNAECFYVHLAPQPGTTPDKPDSRGPEVSIDDVTQDEAFKSWCNRVWKLL